MAAADLALSFWNPAPLRLPEQFSAAYLRRYVTATRDAHPIVFLGDSVLWGYRLPARDAAPSILSARVSGPPVLNLSYEGGSSANSYFMLRYLLSRGIVPRVVVFNVNSKESNVADSAYRRLHPSLEPLVLPMLKPVDRARLDLQPPRDFAATLQSKVEAVWRLYRYRTDLREAIFGTDDAATALKDLALRFTGTASRQAEAHRATADRFLGTYDLSPLASDNIEYYYLKRLGALIKDNRIAAIAILTPTNHRLLSDYIDVPDYAAKLGKLAQPLNADGVVVLDYDRTMRADEFLDNDHLTSEGNRRFEKLLEPFVRRALLL